MSAKPNGSYLLFGKRYEVESQLAEPLAIEKRPGGWLIIHRKDEMGQIRRHRIRGYSHRGEVETKILGQYLYGEWKPPLRAGAKANSDQDFTAQFPGKVRKVMVKEGQRVQEGDPLLMLEAMKMEFPVRAPFVGTVKKILVQAGQQLAPGDRMIEVEEDKSSGKN